MIETNQEINGVLSPPNGPEREILRPYWCNDWPDAIIKIF